jgi:hypothetical protein
MMTDLIQQLTAETDISTPSANENSEQTKLEEPPAKTGTAESKKTLKKQEDSLTWPKP